MRLKRFLKKFDLFGESVSLRFSGKKKFQTVLGSCLSLLMICVIFIFSYSKINSVIYRNTIYIQNKDEIALIPPQLDFHNRFAIFMTPYEVNSLSGKRFFDFYATIGTQTLLKNGTTIRVKQNFNLKKCSAEDFPMFSKEDLVKKGLNTWLCINATKNDDLTTIGTFGSEIYQYIEIGVSGCSNISNAFYGDFCASHEDLDGLVKKYPKFYLNLIMVNSLIDLTNFEKPVSPYIETSTYLISLNNYFIQKEFYFTPLKIMTDATRTFNFLREFSDSEEIDDWIYEKDQDGFVLNEGRTIDGRAEYTNLYLRSGPKTKQFFRKYDTLQDFLQALGSFFSLFFIIFKTFSQFFLFSRMNRKIAYAIYNFKDTSGKKASILKKLYRFIKGKVSNLMAPQPESVVPPESEVTRQVIQKKINDDLDIINILNRLKQFDILKSLLLTPEQKYLLDLAGKPKFTDTLLIPSTNKVKQMVSITKSRCRARNRSEQYGRNSILKPSMIVSQTKKAYERVINEKNKEINNKLLGMLDHSLIKKIRNSHEGNNNGDKYSQKKESVKNSFLLTLPPVSKKNLEISCLAYCKEES